MLFLDSPPTRTPNTYTTSQGLIMGSPSQSPKPHVTYHPVLIPQKEAIPTSLAALPFLQIQYVYVGNEFPMSDTLDTSRDTLSRPRQGPPSPTYLLPTSPQQLCKRAALKTITLFRAVRWYSVLILGAESRSSACMHPSWQNVPPASALLVLLHCCIAALLKPPALSLNAG